MANQEDLNSISYLRSAGDHMANQEYLYSTSYPKQKWPSSKTYISTPTASSR
jgi:hypothetical protein